MTQYISRQAQIDALKKDWAENPRWKGVRRPYSAEEVVSLRGSFVLENTIAQRAADKLWSLINGSAKKGYV
ncbi:MAG: isocitrate lyase, partial [Plesiomonas shigelloides]